MTATNNVNNNSNNVNNNNHEYVDLGLPSHTLWATCNVGADKPTDSGLYFAWGDSKGYTAEQVGNEDGKKAFGLKDYKWYAGHGKGHGTYFKKYPKAGAILDSEDDMATANMGGDWHLPTPHQIEELLENTTSEWINQNGVNGWLFTSKIDDTKSIFIPAAGYFEDGLFEDENKYGAYWCNRLATFSCANLFMFNRHWNMQGAYYRAAGLPVRGVIG